MKNALISVYHKDGITEFAQGLIGLNFTIYASGGTAKHLSAAGVPVTDVATLVGGEAILGHRVVTLSRQIHAGLLSRNIQEDIDELAKLNIPRIDLVCVDLYPLEAEISKEGSTRQSVIDQTDIGGPTMIRSGIKGQRIVVCDPSDRNKVLEWLRAGSPEDGFVEKLGAKGEYVISKYCMASAAYLSNGTYAGMFGEQVATCKYGENAYQTPAAVFSSATADPLALDKFKVIEGTPPSYNNFCDFDRLLQTITHIAAAHAVNFGTVPLIAVGGKHGNPCGAAAGNNAAEVLAKMMAGDPLAIFGGLIMTNFPIDEALAEQLAGKMLDGAIAPAFTDEAVAKMRRKGDRCRFVVNPALKNIDEKSLDTSLRFRYVRGGFLRQPNYSFVMNFKSPELQKHSAATPEQEHDLLLAWAVGSTSNSNTITLVKSGQLIGNGVGQQDRVGAANLAIARATRSKHDTQGAVAYSDSFFPFSDGPQTLIDGGVKAILTSSGSVRDADTIDVCTKNGVALYMIPDSTGRGFFGH